MWKLNKAALGLLHLWGFINPTQWACCHSTLSAENPVCYIYEESRGWNQGMSSELSPHGCFSRLFHPLECTLHSDLFFSLDYFHKMFHGSCPRYITLDIRTWLSGPTFILHSDPIFIHSTFISIFTIICILLICMFLLHWHLCSQIKESYPWLCVVITFINIQSMWIKQSAQKRKLEFENHTPYCFLIRKVCICLSFEHYLSIFFPLLNFSFLLQSNW